MWQRSEVLLLGILLYCSLRVEPAGLQAAELIDAQRLLACSSRAGHRTGSCKWHQLLGGGIVARRATIGCAKAVEPAAVSSELGDSLVPVTWADSGVTQRGVLASHVPQTASWRGARWRPVRRDKRLSALAASGFRQGDLWGASAPTRWDRLQCARGCGSGS